MEDAGNVTVTADGLWVEIDASQLCHRHIGEVIRVDVVLDSDVEATVTAELRQIFIRSDVVVIAVRGVHSVKADLWEKQIDPETTVLIAK